MDQNNQFDPPNEWQTSAFNSQFQNNVNPEDFVASPFGGNPMQSFLNFFPPSSAMKYNEGSGDTFMQNAGFQPEVGLYNGAAFAQNENINPNPQQFSPAQFNIPAVPIPTLPRPTTTDHIARAAELRAELLKRKQNRASSATPPVGGSIAKQAVRVEGPSSLRGSPKTPVTAAEKRDQELNVNELISQYSESKPAANASVRLEETPREDTVIKSQQTLTNTGVAAKSQAALSLGSPTKVAKPATNGKQSGGKVIGPGKRHASNGSLSEASEGEIREDTMPPAAKSIQHEKPKEIQSNVKMVRNDENRMQVRDEQIGKPSHPHTRNDSPPRRPPQNNPKTQPVWARDDRREESEPRPDKRSYQPDQRNDRKQHQDLERPPLSRREPHDEEYRRPEHIMDQNRAEIARPVREIKPPTLQELLPLDDDLREWLDITGYHNAPYRNKILTRRRAIAALDAQREKLLAEMEAEERAGIPPAVVGQIPTSSMLPPPPPNKVETLSAAPTTNIEPDSQRDRPISNKRPYSEDQREGFNPGKMARLEDRIAGPRVKEEDYDFRRPRSRGNEMVHRPFDPRDDRDSPRGRYDGRARSRERELSPRHRAYENRPPARTRPYDEAFSERDEFQEREKRPFEVRGGYRGRAFDPNYKTGRGRGRGRGGRGDSREREREFKREPEPNDSHFGSRIANGRPFKDSKGFDRGGKGETRYFIVKSFNEENVLRCIEDSVWTTQLQNGETFKEAFETCKNVILVFSINKSRAFQGYARMESLPGSVEVPDWQKDINWAIAGAFKVKWLVICSTRFHRIGHLKNALNGDVAVLIGKDGQEIDENCGASLIELIDEEARHAVNVWRESGDMWNEEF